MFAVMWYQVFFLILKMYKILNYHSFTFILVQVFISNIKMYKISNYYFFGVIWYQLFLSDCGGARGVLVIVVGNGHGDTSSNPWRDWLHFT